MRCPITGGGANPPSIETLKKPIWLQYAVLCVVWCGVQRVCCTANIVIDNNKLFVACGGGAGTMNLESAKVLMSR